MEKGRERWKEREGWREGINVSVRDYKDCRVFLKVIIATKAYVVL
jgi:hypothetical protein